MPIRKEIYCLLVWLCTGLLSFSQTSPIPEPGILAPIPADSLLPAPPPSPAAAAPEVKVFFVVGNIVITGNKKTKEHIVLRELPFRSGDSVRLPELVAQFKTAREQLMTTRLFIDAVVALKSIRGYTVDISIDLKERWYLFPLPYLKPVDRNLSEWARQGYGTDRLDYGFKFTHYNFSGRNDKLRFWLITGYSKQIQFEYEQPYADSTLQHGYKIGFSYMANKEVNYATINNQQQFTDTLGGTQTITGSIEYRYRPGLRTFHALRFAFTHFKVDDRILDLNPKYFHAGVSAMALPEISYTVKHYNVNYIPYPLTGWMGEASILKKGIHSYTSMWELSAKYNRAIDLGKKWYFNWQAQGMLRYPFEQPFYNSKLFGYKDMFLRGLENYVIDGVAGGMSRHTFRRELFSFNIPTFLRSRTHDHVPFRVFAKAYTDIGYGYNKSFRDNSLVNKMLYTTGFGIDMVTFYDFVFRFDYSFNQLGQNGLFLHFKNEF